MVIHLKYLVKIVDVETTFFYCDIKDEIYIKCPQSMSGIGKDDCIILHKCIYSIVQAAQQYYMKVIEILENLGFVGDNVGPCFYVKKSTKSIVYVALYVDNNLMVGNIETVDGAIPTLKMWNGYRTTCHVK